MKHPLHRSRVVLALLAGALPPIAAAQWPSVHFDAANNAVVPGNAVVTDLTTGEEFSTGPASLSSAIRPIIALGNVYTIATETDPADRIWIRAFDKTDLSAGAESPDLDPGVSVSFGTASAPVVDAGENALYYATGSTVYRLNADTLTLGAPGWSTVLSDSNTDSTAGASYTVLNSSPALGDGKVYVKTYPTTFGDTTAAQVVALEQATGSVAWYARCGGRGTSSPLYVDTGTAKLVIVDYQPSATDVGLQAYDAESTGEATPFWTSSATVSAGTFHGVWGDLMTDGTHVYTVTTDVAFPGPSNGHLLKVEAATGTVADSVAIVGTDIPPALIGGLLYVLHEDGELRRYSTADLSLDGTPASIGGSTFRNYFAATDDAIYLAQSGIGLRLLGLDGTVQSASPTSDPQGPVSIDAATGRVYTHLGSGALAVYTGASTVREWRVLD